MDLFFLPSVIIVLPSWMVDSTEDSLCDSTMYCMILSTETRPAANRAEIKYSLRIKCCAKGACKDFYFLGLVLIFDKHVVKLGADR